jgi:chemotaxis protein MotB
MIELLETIAMKSMKESKVSQSQARGTKGKQTKVSKVHDGMQFTIGGNMTFEPGSAELKEEAKGELFRIAQLLQGRNNKVAVRGHAARKRLPATSPFDDLRDLSYYRAKAVATFLIEEAGMREEALIVDARGDSEPVELQRYDASAQSANRRVEIIMTEALVSDFNPNHDYGDASVASGES